MVNKYWLIQLLRVIFGFSFTLGAFAHEFWLQPLQFQPSSLEPIQAHLKVGQHFKGNTLAYMDVEFKAFNITSGGEGGKGNTRPVSSRFGSVPAVNQLPWASGLTILSYESSVNTVVYDSAEKFQNFLVYEGLDWVKTAHLQRGLPASGFTEVYRRYAKSLLQVGGEKPEGLAGDQVLGFVFEWVLLTNPYRPAEAGDSNMITAQLLWQGKPFAGATVHLFKNQQGQITEQSLVTDEQGKVAVSREEGSIILLNSVQMIEPSRAIVSETGAVWESLWGSITFEIPRVALPVK